MRKQKTENRKQKLVSAILLFTVFLSLFAFQASGQTITVNQGTSHQVWRGWEFTAEAGVQWDANSQTETYPGTFPNYSTALRSAMLDVGLQRARVEVKMADENTVYDIAGNTAAVNDNGDSNTVAASGFQSQRLTRVMDDLVIPYRNQLIAQNESLYIILCVVDFRHTGFKAQDTPAEYAEFLYYYVDKFYTTYGFLPNAIEPVLEADNQSGEWTEAELANNIVAAKARLDAAGYTGMDWITPSVTNPNNMIVWWTNMKAANASLAAIVTDVSYHWYIGNDNLSADSASIRADGKRLSMNEWISADINRLHDDLTIAQVSSWQQYTLTFPYTGRSNDGSQYFDVNTSTWAVTLWERTKYLRGYFKYIRSGATRKGASSDNANFAPVTFANPNGKYVTVVKCAAGGTITITGLPADTYSIRYTTGDGVNAPSAYDTALSNQTITGGQNVSFSMPSAGVVSVFSTSYMQSADNTKAKIGGAIRLQNAVLK